MRGAVEFVPRFDFLDFHPRFEQHQADAGRRVITQEEVEQIWYGERQFVRNKRRKGSYLLRGLTAAGRPITVVVRSMHDPEWWEAYTAW